MVLGLAIGLTSGTTPLYVAEAAPPYLRGQLVTLNDLMICAGQVSSLLPALSFSVISQRSMRCSSSRVTAVEACSGESEFLSKVCDWLEGAVYSYLPPSVASFAIDHPS